MTARSGLLSEPLACHEQEKEIVAAWWWENVQTPCDSFFEAIQTLRVTDTPDQLAELLITLEMSRHAAKNTPYPLNLKETRHLLLEAMANVLAGLAAALNGNLVATNRRITRAQGNLEEFFTVLRQQSLI